MMLFSRRVWLLARRRKSAWASSSLGPPLSSRSDSTDEPRTVSTSHADKEGCKSPEADGWGASAKGAQPRVAARPSAVSRCFAPMSSRAATLHCIAPTSENGLLECPMIARRCFQLVLIKPSHYDDDGYVIRWWRAMIPSNSLAAIYAIAADCAKRLVLGPDVAIDIEAIDETNTRIDVPGLLARFRSHSNFGLVGLVGVQSNQYPRALDIARPFRDAGIQVVMGGFHVSGCLSMLDGHAVDLDTCRDMGIAMFAGEAEDRLDTVLRDAADGRLAPLYDFMKDLPRIEGTPVPFLPKRQVIGLVRDYGTSRKRPPAPEWRSP